MEGLVPIGKIVRPHGIRGEVKVHDLPEIDGRFDKLTDVMIGLNKHTAIRQRVQSMRVSNTGIIMQIRDCSTRNDAERFRDNFLFVPQSESAGRTESKLRVHHFIGMTVFSDDGKFEGTIEDVITSAAHEIFVVDMHGKETLIPAVEEFIVQIDEANGRMLIKSIPGLFEVSDAD